MFQTFWDINRQSIRKLVDFFAGAAVAGGYVTDETAAIWVGLLVAVLNTVWWWIDNRSKVTVEGLAKKGATDAAETVAAVKKRIK